MNEGVWSGTPCRVKEVLTIFWDFFWQNAGLQICKFCLLLKSLRPARRLRRRGDCPILRPLGGTAIAHVCLPHCLRSVYAFCVLLYTVSSKLSAFGK